ncbi:TPA: helix-turn-helix transcriptional regulator [Clostridioides difficile]|nr:helix-turn-helix transcriptional regulator [Clostridioides difficile]
MKLSNVTEFGIFVRKLRHYNNEFLEDMSKKLNVAPSYLSMVETGKRNIPKEWQDTIVEKYNLSNNEMEDLKIAILHSKKEIKIETTDLNKDEKELIFAFANHFRHLNHQDKEKIRSILKK